MVHVVSIPGEGEQWWITYLAAGLTEPIYAPLEPASVGDPQYQLQDRKVRLFRPYAEIGLPFGHREGDVSQVLLLKHPDRLYRLERRSSTIIDGGGGTGLRKKERGSL